MKPETHAENLAKARRIMMTDPVNDNFGDHVRATLYYAEDMAINSLKANSIDPATLNLDIAKAIMNRPDVTERQKACVSFATFLTRIGEGLASEQSRENAQLAEGLIYNSIYAGVLMHSLDPGVIHKFELALKYEKYMVDREKGGEKSAVAKTNWYVDAVNLFDKHFASHGHTKTSAQYEKLIFSDYLDKTGPAAERRKRYSASVARRIIGLCLYAKRYESPDLVDYLIEKRHFPNRTKKTL